MHVHCLLKHACIFYLHLVVGGITLEIVLALKAPINMIEREPGYACSSVVHTQTLGYLCCTALPVHVESISNQRCDSMQAGSTRGPS